MRADSLVELLIGSHTPQETRRLRALRLRGARVTGQLDLEAATLSCPLLLRDCYLEQPLNLKGAQAPALHLPGCHVPGLTAEQLETRGSLELDQGFTATGEVSLLGAHIGGRLKLNRANLTNPDGFALNADGLTVDQSMLCNEGFTATGEVNLINARIGGTLEFDGATLTNPNGIALNANRLRVDQSMFCRRGFTANGDLRLVNAHIGGVLDFRWASFTNSGKHVLSLEGVHRSRFSWTPDRQG